MDRKQTIAALEEIALLLSLKNANPFKIRAYQNAARALQTLDRDVQDLVESGDLAELKGFGKALVSKITELVTTGKLEYLDNLRGEFPASLQELLKVPGLGPKKVKLFYEKLQIDSTASLAAACRDGRIEALPGCGQKTAHNLLQAIERMAERANLFLFPTARSAAEGIRDTLLDQDPGLNELVIAGSLRRYKETTKDADLIGCSSDPLKTMDAFTSLAEVETVLGHGETKSSVILQSGLQVDLRLVPKDTFPTALHHFTGSREHNIAMRQRAQNRNLRLSEWGIFQADDSRLPCNSEDQLFAALDLHPIPPELREGRGELARAEKAPCPALITPADYQGSLHNHSTASDGSLSIDDLITHVRSLGHRFTAVTDHSRASFQANGLKAERLQKQLDTIGTVREGLPSDFYLFSGIECDIDKDGNLDLDDSILAQVDVVIVSVHSSFSQDKKSQTRRIIRAIEHPAAKILAHPTGRLLLKRDGYDLDIPKILDAAAANQVAIEMNCHPMRLDLSWQWWQSAKEKGVPCALNPDAHKREHFDNIPIGVGFARKGRLEPDDVLNCWDIERLKEFFEGK